MKYLFDIADKYYNQVGVIAAMKQNKIYLACYFISILLLIISIALMLKNPLEPISWGGFIYSCKGLFYISSLCLTLLFYWLIDRAKIKDLKTKKVIMCTVLNCNEQDLRDYFDGYEEAYEKYKKYNEDIFKNPIEPLIKISKFISWIATTILAVTIKEQMNKPDNLVKLSVLIILLYSVFAIFWSLMPEGLKGLKRLFRNKHERINFLFSDLSYFAPFKTTKEL